MAVTTEIDRQRQIFSDASALALSQVRVSPLTHVELKGAVISPLYRRPDLPHGCYGGVYDAEFQHVPLSCGERSWIKVVDAEPGFGQGVEIEHLSGSALYCGPLFTHFGHFLLEATARLWWGIANGFTGTYAFSIRPQRPIPGFAQEFFRLLGIDDRVVAIRRPSRFDHVVVPEAAFQLQKSCHANFLLPFRQIAGGIDADPRYERLYVSRRGLTRGQIVVGEEYIVAVFAKNGFTIINPERLPLDRQIAAFLGARSIAGLVGSGLHSMVYGNVKDAYYVARSPRINLTFPMIDHLTGTAGHYLPGANRESMTLGRPNLGSRTPILLDLNLAKASLTDAGFDCSGVPKPNFQALRAVYAELYNSFRRASQARP